mmetsp:Transcript_28412/g.82179  ORF Transcript_28412/g.82179 Transcript_28412/m.82179 type:complete len:198 (-) Transcript_28412:1260-1853(-)
MSSTPTKNKSANQEKQQPKSSLAIASSQKKSSKTKNKSTNQEKQQPTKSLAIVPYNPNPFPFLSPSLQIHDPTLRKLIFSEGSHSDAPDVPSCVLPTILAFCDAVTLSRASCTCRDWRSLAACNKMWENLCRKKFGVSADCIRPRPDPTKMLYVLTHRSLKEACRSDINPFTGRARRAGLGGAFGQRIPIAAMASML